jgi:hypothetical protein
VAEVVRGELRLPAVRGALGQVLSLLARTHRKQDPGVVDEDVRGPRPGGGEGVDGGEVGQVEACDTDIVAPRGGLDIGGGVLAGVGVADGQGHPGAGAGQRAGGLHPDPRSAAGHHGALAGQVDAGEHLGGGRLSVEGGRDARHCWYSLGR